MKYRKDQIFKRLLSFAAPYKGRIILSMIASAGVAASDGVIAKLVEPFIDRIVIAQDYQLAKMVPMFAVGLAVFKGASRYVQEYFISTAGQMAIQDIRNALFGQSMDLSMRYYTGNASGSLMSKILNDVNLMQSVLSNVVVSGIRETLTLVGLAGVAFYTDWRMALMSFVVIPAAAVPASIIGHKIKKFSRHGQGAMGDLTTALEQAFSGIKVVKAFATEDREKKKFFGQNRAYYRFIRKTIKYGALSSPVMEILTATGIAAVLWYGLSRVLAGEMTQGQLFSVLAAILLMYTPLKRLTKVNNTVQQAMGGAERVFEVLDEKIEIVEAPNALTLKSCRGEVCFDNVSFSYDAEPVVQHLDLSVSPGEVVALVGPSGAGKSTIAGLISRFYDPTEGRILIDGEDIKMLSIRSLHENLALVDQETFLFNATISENISYGSDDATEDEILAAAQKAFADEFICLMPEGYQTLIGDRGVRLSGGQRQRLCIARAILRNAPILLLDEATSALDTESEAMVQRALSNLMRERTTFVIAHRLSTIKHADRILVLEQGVLKESGSHQQLMELDGLYRRLHDMQFNDAAPLCV
ncbi:lipid A export permease/ATP-binding protein MsbA [Geopsychrobacter electrodiphilus]|uniref:lipid A export permease/ATP-binding protein MsbA n=1 Tax=Geopsychrobacter electrodiphilus TaxID=225196 RepID=UPI00036DCD07|nr:lipid A export permease/ATP-binding protein MsbA [Geopsychrobacter electrodiphilus]